jgi:hypothetical protein
MSDRYSMIKNRYHKIFITAGDDQMSQDIQVLLAYIDTLHLAMANTAFERMLTDAEETYLEEYEVAELMPN